MNNRKSTILEPQIGRDVIKLATSKETTDGLVTARKGLLTTSCTNFGIQISSKLYVLHRYNKLTKTSIASIVVTRAATFYLHTRLEVDALALPENERNLSFLSGQWHQKGKQDPLMTCQEGHHMQDLS